MPLSVLHGRASACRTFPRADHSIEQMSEAVSTAVAGHVPALDRGSYSGGHEYTISDSRLLVCKFYKSKPPEAADGAEKDFILGEEDFSLPDNMQAIPERQAAKKSAPIGFR